jgi:CRP-like cAMP-binding protein
MTFEKFAQDFVLCREGEKGDRFWILTKGTVELRDSTGNVKKTLTADEETTPAFGELALMDDEDRKFTIVAVNPIEVKILTRKHLRACFSVHDGAENTMLAAVMMKYQAASDPKADADRLKAAPPNVLIDILMQKEQEYSSSAIILKKKKDGAKAELNARLNIQGQ